MPGLGPSVGKRDLFWGYLDPQGTGSFREWTCAYLFSKEQDDMFCYCCSLVCRGEGFQHFVQCASGFLVLDSKLPLSFLWGGVVKTLIVV